MRDLNGKVAVITGAGGGIGSALAECLASRGMHLALLDVSTKALAETVLALEGHNRKISTHQVDVANVGAVDDVVKEVIGHQGSVNLLVNCAGLTLQKSFANHTNEDWERILGANLRGPINVTRAFLPELRKAAPSHIVNLSSMAAFMGLPTQSSYSVTKAGLKALSDALWIELQGDEIGVTAVFPGAIRTNMILATLDEADDQEQARRIFELTQRTAMDPRKAAMRIVKAIERNQKRVKLGADSVALDLLTRLAPHTLIWLFAKLFRSFGQKSS